MKVQAEETRRPRAEVASVGSTPPGEGAAARASIVALLALLVALPSLRYGFVLDDVFHIVENRSIRDLGNVFEIFSEPVYPGNLYRPLPILSYALTHAVSGLEPLPYHLVNALLHAAASVLAFLVLGRMISAWPATVGAVLFAVHPVHLEAVANVSGRTELLSALFSLSAILLVSGRETLPRAALAALLFFLGLLSKESSVTVLLLAPLVVWVRGGPVTRRFAVRASALHLLALGAYFVLRSLALSDLAFGLGDVHQLDNPLVRLAWLERVMNAIALQGRYLILAFFPAVLRSDYSYAEIVPIFERGAREGALLYSLASLSMALAAIGLLRRHAYGGLLGWFFLSFAVTSNIFVAIGTVFGERLLYLPSVGACGLLALGLHELSRPLRNLCSLLVIVLYSSAFALNSPYWFSNETLHRRSVAVSPRSAKARANHAVVLLSEQKVRAARAELWRSLRTEPSYVDAVYLQGLASIMGGDPERGRRWLVQAINMEPGHLNALNLYGRLLVELGNEEEARRIFGQALYLAPEDLAARMGLAALCDLSAAECEREVADLEKELESAPGLAGLRDWMKDVRRRKGRA